MPICNYEGDVIGVAQIINKTNGSQEFTPRDVEVLSRNDSIFFLILNNLVLNKTIFPSGISTLPDVLRNWNTKRTVI